MKIAVFALISMFVIVQACGRIIVNHPSSVAYYTAVLNARRSLAPSYAAASAYGHYHNKQHAYKHNVMQTVTTSDGRRMIVPVSVLQYPVGAYGSSSYSAAAGSSASAASQRNQQSYNYVAARRSDAAAEETPAEGAEYVQTVPSVPTCNTQNANNGDQEPIVNEEASTMKSNAEKYREEICSYIADKAESMIKDMSEEDREIFINDFVSVADQYCSFKTL